MPLPMARPMKHDKTGVYYLRKRVPVDLVTVVGKREEKFSLGTKDPKEAKALLFAAVSALEERWASLRKGQQSFDNRQVQALAGDFYRDKVAEHAEEPGSPEVWQRLAAADRSLQDLRRRTAARPSALRLATGWSEAESLIRARRGATVDEVMAAKGLIVTEADHRRIVLAVSEATILAHESLARNAAGDYSPDKHAERFPPSRSAHPPLKFEPLWADYQRLGGLSPATVKRWQPILKQFIAFVGVDDLRRVTTADVVRWRDKLLKEGSKLSPLTVRDVYIAAPKALLDFALHQTKIGANPASDITVRVKKKDSLRERDFEDEEAEMILSASLDVWSRHLVERV